MTPCIWIYEILGWNCGRDRFEIDLNKYGLHPGLHVGNLLLSFSPRLSMYSKPIDKTGQSKVQKNIETAWNCYLPGKVISNKIMGGWWILYIYICVCVCTYVHVYIYIYTHRFHMLWGCQTGRCVPNAMAFAGHPIVFRLEVKRAQFFKPAAGATL